MLTLAFLLPTQVLKAQGIPCTNTCIVFKDATNMNVLACTPCTVVNYGVTATDPCCPGGVTLTFSPTNGSCFPQGVTEVTCTANDQCGNCNSTNFFVGVNCPHCTNSCIQFQNATNIVVNRCTSCAFVTYPVTATDTCGCSNTQVTLAFFPTNGTCFPQGTNPVTCFATDSCGNCNVTNFFVIVQCPKGCIQFQNLTNEVVVNSCSSCAGVVYPNITATNICCPETPVTVTFNPPPGNYCFPQGTNLVTVTAMGGCNLSATTNFSVIVQCPTNTCTNSCIQFQSATNLTAFSCASCTPVSYPLTAMDTCCTDAVALTFSPTNGSCFAQGTTLVTCTANDQCGHCNTTNFTVTVLCPCTTNYVGNSLTPGNIDDQDFDHGPLVILGEYNPTGPNPSSAKLLSSGTIQDVKFYGGSKGYNFTLYALSYSGTGPHSLEQEFTVVASQSFSGPATNASLITLPVSPSFTVNAGNLLAFAGWGPFYPQTNNDALNSDATYEDSTNVNSYIATPPGGAGTEFIVGVYTDPGANYEYIQDNFGNQGRTYRFGVDLVSPCSNNCIQFQNATNILVNNCGNCVVVNYAVTATDACCSNGVGGLTFSPTNGFCFPQGTTLVTCTATDACGFTSTTNFTVTVQCPPIACVETNGVKYVQGPNLTGLDVWDDGPWVLADDFICTNAGPISDIHIWGSWNRNMVLPGSLTFTLAVYSDIPASPTNGFSHPGTKLWSQVFAPGQYAENAVLPSQEQFFDPGNNKVLGGDTEVWYYCFYPTNLNQTGSIQSPATYWLMAYAQLPAAITNAGQGTNFEYGWKDTTNVQHDISVWAPWPGSPPPAGWPWAPNLMNGKPFDLAFKLTTPTNPCEISVVCAPDKSVQCGSFWNFDPPFVLSDPCCNQLPVPVLTSAVTNITCPESITATWTITDCVGTVTYCSQNVTLTNPSPPVITCSNIIAYTCTSNQQVFWPVTATNCTGFTNGIIVTSTPFPGTFFNANTTNTVNLTATDPCGNSNACSFTVTVLRPPVGSLTIVTNGTHSIVVTWTNDAILQSSTNITGVWTDLPGATSPFTTNTGPPDVFFRLRCQSP